MRSKRFNFTKTGLDALPLPEASKHAYYYDAKQHALGLRVSSRGNKSFVFYRSVHGRPVRQTIGRYPDMSIEKARGRVGALNAALADGTQPGDLPGRLRGDLTLRELFDEYVERHANRSRSLSEMRDIFDRYLGEVRPGRRKKHGRLRFKRPGSVNWTNRKVSTISHNDVQRLHADLGRLIGGHTANRVLQLLRAMFNKAKEWGLHKGENPAARISRFKERSRERFLLPDELPRFFEALAKEPNGTLRDFFLTCLLTGARRANVAAMRWTEVDLTSRVWRIPDTKTGEPYVVPLPQPAVDLLTGRAAVRTCEWVFPGSGARGHLASPKSGWKRLLKRAKITNLRLHDLRRTLGSYQAITGASLVMIGRTLNHKDPKSTVIYARLHIDPVREAQDRAIDAMLAAARPKKLADQVSRA